MAVLIRYSSFLSLLFLLACGGPADEGPDTEYQVVRGSAQGTSFRIKYVSEKAPEGLEESIDRLLTDVDSSFSMYIDSSGVLDFERDPERTCMDSLFRDLYGIAKEVYERTDGAFDPTVKPLVDAWGFGPDGRPKGEPDSLERLLERVGMDRLTLDTLKEKDGGTCYALQKPHPDMAFDPNAIAQGYTVDLLAELLQKRHGIDRAMIQLGGEVRALGRKNEQAPWLIGVEKPVPPKEKRALKAVAELEDLSMATSGSYRKFYEKGGKRYPHTIDPRSGKPVQHQLLSVTVTHPICAYADAYATAFMVMGADRATEFVRNEEKLEAYFIMGDGKGGFKAFATEGMKKLLREH